MTKRNHISRETNVTTHVRGVVGTLVRAKARRATKFVSPTLVVRATRRRYRGRIPSDSYIEIVLNICRPNYAERKFVKACKRAGEPFPVRKIKITMLPVAAKKARKARK